MTILAIVCIAFFIFVGVVFYCLQDRQVSGRFGAFYLLLGAVACEALLVSLAATHVARGLRDRITDDFPGTGDLVPSMAVDPGGAGTVERQMPAFPKPEAGDRTAWQDWQSRLRSFLRASVFEIEPASESVVPKLESTTGSDQGRLIRREYTLSGTSGDSIVAVLLLPAAAPEPLPGVLVLPGHVKPGRSGLAQMVLPVSSYQHSAAHELALAGFATLTIELRGFGLRGPPDYPEHKTVAYNAILAGGFYKQVLIHDIGQAVDFFASMPEVNPERLGISGVSLGAELAVDYAALDTRIKAISFHSYGGAVGKFEGISSATADQPHYCHIVPGINTVMAREDPFLLLAPRPTQGLRGELEPFADEQFRKRLVQVWTILDPGSVLELSIMPGGGHEYFVGPAIEFFRKNL